MELNPKHPTTEKMRSEWHKIAALLMMKFKVYAVDITIADIESLSTCGKSNIVIKPDDDVIKLRLVDDITALRLSEEK